MLLRRRDLQSRDQSRAALGSPTFGEGAMGYLGSTNIAYGPEDDNDCADLVCSYFLESARSGASLGRSLLEARQQYIAGAVPVDPTALKTMGQFLLLGDPSLHAVAGAKPKTRPTAKTLARSAARTASTHAVTRGALTETAALLTARRRQCQDRGAHYEQRCGPLEICQRRRQGWHGHVGTCARRSRWPRHPIRRLATR